MKRLTVDYIKRNIEPTQDQIMYYNPERVCIEPTILLDNIGDEMSVAQGIQPFFNHDNHEDWEECDYEGWYDIYAIVDNDNDTVDEIVIEDYCGNYIGSVELDDECKQALMEIIWNYYDGKEHYKEAVKDYNYCYCF